MRPPLLRQRRPGDPRMRNEQAWGATKYIRDPRGRWRANRAAAEVTPMSWFTGDIQAAAYAEAIAEFAVSGPLVDLGCGAVPLYDMYRRIATEVTCVDWPATLHGSSHVDVSADLDGSELALPDGHYATVIATDVLEHLQHPDRLLANAARVLRRPGGRLIIGVPFMYWIHEEPHDYHRYTEFRLRSLCEQAGLDVIHLEPYGARCTSDSIS